MSSSFHESRIPTPGVLVVDDDEHVRTMLAFALHEHGFAVSLATNGQEAVELFRQHRGAIAVVLLDVQMPFLDGPAVLAALRQAGLTAPCLFMSGDTGRYSVDDLLALGAARVLTKPLDLTALVAAIRQGTAGATEQKSDQECRN